MKAFFFLLLLLPAFGQAQIKFQHVSLAEAKAMAKAQNKPLFVDVFATWCGPCKYMANTTFQDKEVSEYFNTEFISVKVDGEKEDGPQVMQEYGVTAYPTLLFIQPDGTLAQQFVGAMDVPTLKRYGIRVAHPEKDPSMLASKAYHSSKKEKEDFIKYLTVLDENQSDSLQFYAINYYTTYDKLDFTSPFDQMVFIQAETDAFSERTDVFIAQIDQVDPRKAHDKMVNFILGDLERAKQTGDFSICEKTLRKVYPVLESLKVMELPPLEDLVTGFRSEFEAY